MPVHFKFICTKILSYSIILPICMANSEFHFTYTGAPPTNIVLEQIGISMVHVTWTAPAFAPPVGGYRIRIVLGSQISGSVDTKNTSVTFSLINGQYGMYVARVMSLSQHLPGGTAESEEVTVLGEPTDNLAPDVSEGPAATSVTTVSEITVTAYTTVGRGEESTNPDVVTPAQPEIRT